MQRIRSDPSSAVRRAPGSYGGSEEYPGQL
jgi:hypothetical protein